MRSQSVLNDISVQGTSLESGCAPFQLIASDPTNWGSGDMGLLVGSPVAPSMTDSSLAPYSDNLFAWSLENTCQSLVEMEENRLPSDHNNIQQAPPESVTTLPAISSRWTGTQLPEDITIQKFTLQDILIAGIHTLSKGENQAINISSANNKLVGNRGDGTRGISASSTSLDHLRLPDIRLNTIQLTTMSFVAACMANAAMLGLSPEELMNKESQSPFYQAQISHEVAQTPCTLQFAHLKPHLRPSSTQLVHPHHPYLDTLPFLVFRNRAIQLLGVQPPPFSQEELCRDLQSDGIICWGSAGRAGSGSTGTGAPWDIRSWEIQPWFLKKWWLLIDGVDGEMYQQTRWWSEVRGGKSSYPWQIVS